MQNKTTLQTPNEILTVNEPWHRGSGFTWMLLALAGLVFFLSGAVAKAQTTVNYTMQLNQFDRDSSTGGNTDAYNDGSTQVGIWMEGDNTSQGTALWKTFRTGSATSSTARELQVGDSFTIKLNTRGVFYGSLGVSLNDGNNFTSDTFPNRLENSRVAIIQNGHNFGSGNGGRGSWFSDAPTDQSFNITPDSNFRDYDLTFQITSGNTANLRIQGGPINNDQWIRDVVLGGSSGANIDSFSVWLSDDRSLAWNDSGGGRGNLTLKSASVRNTGVVELGYAQSGTVSISGVVSDGLAADSTSTVSANSVNIGGNNGSQVNLSGNNTYTGTTTINSNATAEAQNANALGSTSAGTTVTSGGTLKLYDGTGINYAAEAITLNGAGVGSNGALRNTGGANTWNGVITLGSDSRINSTGGTLTIAGGVTGDGRNLTVGGDTDTIISSGITTTTGSLTKDGTGKLTLTGGNTYSGGTTVSAGILSGNTTGIQGNVANSATLEFNQGSTGTYGGIVSGSGKLVKAGAGELTLSGGNTYTGNTEIDAGTLKVTGSLASGSKVYVGNGGNSESATLNLSGTTALGGDIQVNIGTGTRTITKTDATSQTMSGGVEVNKASTVSVTDSGGNLTMSGVTSGSGGMTKSGAGSLTLSGSSANNLSGTVDVTGGTLVLDKDNGVRAVNGQVTIGASGTVRTDSSGQFGSNLVDNSGTLNLNNYNQTLALRGAGSVTLGTAEMTINNTGSDTFSGAITGTGSVVKSGSGTQTLTGANTYSGGTTISGGLLTGDTTGIQGNIINNASLEFNQSTNGGYDGALSGSGTIVKKGGGNVTLGNGNSGYSGNVFVDAGTLSAGSGGGFGTGTVYLGQDNVSSTATVAIGDADGGTSAANTIAVRQGGGTRTISGANTSGSNTFSGEIYLDSDVTLRSGGAGGILNLSGRLVDGATAAGEFSAIISAGTVEFSGNAANAGVKDFTVQNGAELRMNKNAVDAVASTLNINSGGTATLVAANQLGSSAVVNNSGTLATGNNSDSFATLSSSGSITGSGTLTAGTYNISGGTVSANLGTGTLNASGNSTINGNSSAGTLNVTGNATLNGTSAATAVVVTNSGTTLTLGSGANRLSTAANVTLDTGTAISIADNQSVEMLSEAGIGRSGTASIASGKTLTITGNEKGLKYMNSISGDGGLTMSGNGNTDLRLFGSQTYTGATTVTGGKLSTKVSLGSGSISVSGGEFATVTDGGSTGSISDTASVSVSGGTFSLAADDTVGSFVISGGQVAGAALTAATYELNGGTVSANLGAGTATASSGTTALDGSLGATTVNVSGGTVNLGANNRLADGATVNVSSGTLGMGARTDTVGTLNLSGGSVTGSTGNKLTAATYNLTGGTMEANLGAGTVNANSGTTALNGTVDATTINVGGGTLNLGSGGRLSAGATANLSSGTLSTGGNETITRLNATGGTVNLTGDTLTVTGTNGSSSSVGANVTATGGTISVAGTLDYQSTNGTTALSIASGGTLTGSGTTTGKLTINNEGTLSLGNSPGIMTVGSADWLGGGTYTWEIADFTAGAGPGGHDLLYITGGLLIDAGSNDFIIEVASLLANPSANFDLYQNYSFAIATAAGGITYAGGGAFDAAWFTLDTSGFGLATSDGNTASAGFWSVSQTGDSIMLNYSAATAIPEPSSASMLVLGLAAVLAKRRRVARG